MEVRVLGPVEAWHDGALVRFARRQQRLVLGILALQPNQPMPGERLIDLLWGERPPVRARAVLQSRVSELRATLAALPGPAGAVRVATTGAGYLLEMSPQRVDAHRFQVLAARGRAAGTDEERRTQLREALALWRGPVLAGSLPALGAALENTRLTVTEDLLDAELRLGNHGAIVDEAVRLAGEHPTRERFVVHMMLALSRCGRAAEALQAYHAWRGWLRDELGTDPGAEVQGAHASILRGTSSPVRLDGADQPDPDQPDGTDPVPVPRTLLPDIADFAGRRREAGQVRDLLLRPSTGQATITAVIGPGGAGKTALAIHVAHAVSAHFPDGQLYANLRGSDADEPVRPFEVLGGFLRLLAADGQALPETLDERAGLYRSLLAGRSVLVLLDDAAADEQVLPLIPNSSGCAVVVTGRSHLGAALGVHPLRLDVMDETDAVEVLHRVGGRARFADAPAATAELARRCGYLPLALRVVAAKLAAKPHWSVDKVVGLLDDEQERLDRMSHGHLDVRASIALSYGHLRPGSQRLLRCLGHFDLPDVSVWLSAALLDCHPDDAEELLEQLVDAQLLQLATGSGDRPRYRLHDLVRIFARERATAESPDEEREAATIRGFGAFLQLLDDLQRATYGGAYRAVHGPALRWPGHHRWSPTSLPELQERFTVERSNLVATVRRAARDGQSAAAWDLACTAAMPLFAQRQFDDIHVSLEAALAVTLRTGDQRGEAATRHRLGAVLYTHQQFDAANEQFRRAAELFELFDDIHGQALVSHVQGMVAMHQGRSEDALEHYHASLAGMRAVADHAETAQILRSLGQVHMQLGEDDTADAFFEQALAAHREAGNAPIGRVQLLFWRGMLWLRTGRHTAAESLFEEVLEVTLALGDRSGQAQALRGLGICHVRRGDRAAGRAALDQALHVLRGHAQTIVTTQIRGTIAELFDKD